MKTIICAICLACILVSCTTDFNQIETSGLSYAFGVNSSPTFRGYFYLGSDQTHHYFVAKWKYERDRHFKVSKSDLLISKEEPFGQREIGIFTFKPTIFETDEFAVIGETKIYRER